MATELEKIHTMSNYVQSWLDAPGNLRQKLRTNGLDRNVVLNSLKMIPMLLTYIEYLLAGVRLLAEPSKSGCLACKANEHLAAQLLAGMHKK